MKFLVPEPSETKEESSRGAFSAEPQKAEKAHHAKASVGKSEIHLDPARIPAPPKTVEETGIETLFLRDLLLKTIFRTNIELATRLTTVMCLLPTVLQELSATAAGVSPTLRRRAALRARGHRGGGVPLVVALLCCGGSPRRRITGKRGPLAHLSVDAYDF